LYPCHEAAKAPSLEHQHYRLGVPFATGTMHQ
jgi:hypothetical protein